LVKDRIVAIKIPNTVFEGLVKWMVRGPWPEHFQEAIDDHLHAYCDVHDLDTFDELADKISQHWVSTLNDIAMNDFLSRETEDGNVVDLYLKRRGWNEKAIPKAYLRGIRDSVMSIYEVSDIEPGKSFLARDLILGGDPIRVEEKSGTQSMLQWEHIAMRIVEVRGHRIIAGGLLPYKPELSEQIIEEIYMRADGAEVGIEEMFSEQDETPEPELIQNLSLAMVLKMSAPLFSEAWLAGNVLDPDDIELPTLFNSEGDEIEFIQLHCKFTKGTTQKQLRSLLDAAEDMEPASAKIWNWVATEPKKSKLRPKSTGSVTYKSELEGGLLVHGMIELRGKTLEASVNSAERAEQLTKRLRSLLGELVAPPIMVRQTIEQAMADQRGNPTPREQLDLPPDIESQLMKEFYDRHYRETLDQPIPMLGNKSPSDAAKTPKGREKVAAWLKHLETGEAKTRQNKSTDAYDFSWIWQELGVQDLRE
tara:strand:- start:1713 stop:3146 length:1434 start_codon:yes stop_codon:yes gene_type:complete